MDLVKKKQTTKATLTHVRTAQYVYAYVEHSCQPVIYNKAQNSSETLSDKQPEGIGNKHYSNATSQ